MLFDDILTSIQLKYRDGSLITLYLVVFRNQYYNCRIIITKIFVVEKVKIQHVLNDRTDFLVTSIELQHFLNRA